MKRLAIGLLLALLLPLFAVQSGTAQDPVVATIDGESAVAPRSANAYTVQVTGGPAQHGGNYSISYYLDGSDLAGGFPLQENPGERKAMHGTFVANVTAPATETTFDVVVRATSTNATTNQSASTVQRFTVVVRNPVFLQARFSNNGASAALNVDVLFYVDDRLVGTEVLDRVDPGQDREVNHTWIPVGIGDGEHTLRVEADLNGDGVVEASAGEVSVSGIFIRTGPGLNPGIAVILVIVLSLLGLLLIFGVRRRLRASR